MGSVAILPMMAVSPLNCSDKELNVENKDGEIAMVNGQESNPEVATTSYACQSQDQNSSSARPESAEDTKSSADNMAKKRKLTAAEKAEAQALKDAEAQRKAEEKARKEEEKARKEDAKRQRDEEKRLKQEEARKEREEKQKAKDAVKAEKDAEKRAKEEAQAKKDKAQLRLGAFFKKSNTDAEASGTSSRRSSIASLDVDLAQDAVSRSDEIQPQISDYERTFPPFFLHAHTTLAPINVHPIDEAKTNWAIQEIEKGQDEPNRRPDTVLGKRKRASYVIQPPVKRLLLEMQGNDPENPIDLEKSRYNEASKELKNLSVKFLKFREDVRPPWIGTYSKAPEGRKFAALCRNPFRRNLPQVNYDYDSEAEWEEPEEGEELNSEGEEDEEDEEDDMEEFLDDEAAEALPKRKQLVGDLEPTFTGLNWENSTSSNKTVQFGSTSIDLEQYRMAVLLDPFSSSYWSTNTPQKSQAKVAAPDGSMHPPVRVPLNTLQGPNQMFPTLKNDTSSKQTKTIPGAKPFPPELLADFKKAVSGSNLSKIGLVEVLKKDFPSITKKTVEQTLLQIAKRVGKKESEKTWQLND